MKPLFLVLLIASSACRDSRPVSHGQSAQPGAPSASEIVDLIAKDLTDAKLFAVDLVSDQPGLLIWAPSFDGIPLSRLAQVRSVKLGTNGIPMIGPQARSDEPGARWQNNWYRFITSPERARRDLIISDERATIDVGVGDAFRDHRVDVRLTYEAVIRFAKPVIKSEDVAYVVDHFRLVKEIHGPPGTATVDAYTGEVVQNWMSGVIKN